MATAGLYPSVASPAAKGHGVLLADAHVHEPLRVVLVETLGARALGHGRGDGHDLLVPGRQRAQGGTENGGVGRQPQAGKLAGQAGLGHKLAHSVVVGRVGLGGLVPLALLGHDVDQHRLVDLLHFLEHLDQGRGVVAVDGADVGEVEGLEQDARGEEGLHRVARTAWRTRPGRRRSWEWSPAGLPRRTSAAGGTGRSSCGSGTGTARPRSWKWTSRCR